MTTNYSDHDVDEPSQCATKTSESCCTNCPFWSGTGMKRISDSSNKFGTTFAGVIYNKRRHVAALVRSTSRPSIELPQSNLGDLVKTHGVP